MLHSSFSKPSRAASWNRIASGFTLFDRSNHSHLSYHDCNPANSGSKECLRTDADRPRQLPLRMNPAMKPLERRERFVWKETMSKLQGIRQYRGQRSKRHDPNSG